eukprot:TRINITY_DN10867_c0_g1_i1.p1 TRINITY_DN10867_c0_g1~~TRINITY_DN10867_c0_g1_i1.p1  ORF type:complete len:349 (+),score=65.79 TRINITY_DN10867_c0_g1_i1:43-1089(+)
MPKKNESMSATIIKLLICITGIYTFYLFYGICQERVTKTVRNGETFRFTFVLLFIQCLVNFMIGVIGSFILKSPKNTTKIYKYGIFSTTYLAAMFCSNYALNFVDYPTQVIGKACKPIPVMIMNMVINKNVYTWKKWVAILVIVAGIALFFYNPNKIGSKKTDMTGVVFLCLSLGFDGFTGPFQKKVLSGDSKPSPSQMIIFMNIFASLYCGIVLAVYPSQLFQAIEFIKTNPDVIQDILLFSVCSALGQHFIFASINWFNALACSMITTTRKFFTLLFSVLFYGHSLLDSQWAGVILVFTGLICDVVIEKSSRDKKEIDEKKDDDINATTKTETKTLTPTKKETKKN